MKVKQCYNKNFIIKTALPCLISLVLGATVTFAIQNSKYAELNNKYLELEQSNNDLRNSKLKEDREVTELRTQLKIAEPFFKLTGQEQKAQEQKAEQLEKENKKKAQEANSIQLASGNYQVGKHFKAGTYNIYAVSGKGNVICSDVINAMMGVGESEHYEPMYMNVTFNNGQVLKIMDVTIKLVPSE